MRRIIMLSILFCLSLPSLAQENESTPYEIALQRIQEAEASGATSLELGGMGLTELPPEIGRLTNLQVLLLYANQLSGLPSEIGNLNNLQFLHLVANQLSSLPPEIGNLSNLQQLRLDNNLLTSLPPEIGRLSQLCRLDFSSNDLRYLPTELAQINRLEDENCGIFPPFNPFISPPQEVIAQGTPAILDYLKNEAWWHLQRLIIGALTSVGLVVAFVLALRWRHNGKRKRKNEEKAHA